MLLSYPDDLPEKSQHQMWGSGFQVSMSNVDYSTANRARWVQGKIVILCSLIHVRLLFVDGALIYGIWCRLIDKFTEKWKNDMTHKVNAMYYAKR